MSSLLETIAFVFGLVALGYLSGWTGHLKPKVGDAMTEFLVGVALPVLLFRTMIEADMSAAAPWLLLSVYFLAAGSAWTGAQLLTSRVFGRDDRAAVVGGVAGAFSNLLLLGFPLILSVYGRAGAEIVSLIIAVHLPIMMVASIVLMEWVKRKEGGSIEPARIARTFLRNLVGNALIVGIIAGLAWRFTGVPLPSFASRFVDTFAGLAGPMALFAMGLSLRGLGISGDIRPGIALAAIKLVAMPGLALLLALLAGLPPLAAKVAVVAASMPTGINPYLIATRFGVGRALASNTLTVATAVAVLTSAFWLFVVEAVFR